MRGVRFFAALACVVVVAAGCSSGDEETTAESTTTTAAATTATVPSCTLAPAPGENRVELSSGGLDRWYLLRVPPGETPEAGWPVVYDFHGFSEGATIHAVASQLGQFGDGAGFVTVTPHGTGDPVFWNATAAPGIVDDVGFVGDLLADVASRVCVDSQRIFATGLSNGAFMVSRLACDYADTFAAVAPVAGINLMEGSCDPARPVPVIAFHGTDDTFVAYDGTVGESAGTLGFSSDSAQALSRLKFAPVPEAASGWAARNGCRSGPTDERLASDVVARRWGDCTDGADVELITIEGGGHTWPGSQFFQTVAQIVGRTTTSIDANELMWAFFQKHPLPD
jgi:polyhydroxybutyrate depolymerase